MFVIQIVNWYVVNLAHVHVGNMLLPYTSHFLRTTVTCVLGCSMKGKRAKPVIIP